jgi:hypothetical protein
MELIFDDGLNDDIKRFLLEHDGIISVDLFHSDSIEKLKKYNS